MTRMFGSIFSEKQLCICSGKIVAGLAFLLAALCLHAPVALAQHGGFSGGHFGGGGGHFGGGMHSNAAGASHGAKASSTPHGTATNTRTSSVAAPSSTSTSRNFIVSPIGHPTTGLAPQPVFFVPVYFGSPFFYGGFNSFGFGCGAFWGAGCFYSPFGYGYGYGYSFGGYYGGFYGGWGGGYTGLSGGSNVYGYASTSSDPNTGFTAPSAQNEVVTYHRPDLVELYFKDGTVYDVIDYWLADGQLHFLTVEQSGQKTVEHAVPFDALNLQITTDENTNRGFQFQLRNQSMEQYFREHPESVPKSVDPNGPQN